MEADPGVVVGQQVHEHALASGLLQGGRVQAAAGYQQEQQRCPHVPRPGRRLHALQPGSSS